MNGAYRFFSHMQNLLTEIHLGLNKGVFLPPLLETNTKEIDILHLR